MLEIAQTVGLSQAAIANQLGINRVQPHYWAHGLRPIPERFQRPLIALIMAAVQRFAVSPLPKGYGHSLEERHEAEKARLAIKEQVHNKLTELLVAATARHAHQGLQLFQQMTHGALDRVENAHLLLEYGTALATYGKVLQDWVPLLNISGEKDAELEALNDRLDKEPEDANARGELDDLGESGSRLASNH